MVANGLKSAFCAQQGSVGSLFRTDLQEDEGWLKVLPNKMFSKKEEILLLLNMGSHEFGSATLPTNYLIQLNALCD